MALETEALRLVGESSLLARLLMLTLLLAGTSFVCLHFFYPDAPRIKGLPEVPNASILAGHLYQLGRDHATTAEQWTAKYSWPVFQIRMGRRRAIILNSFDAAHEFLVKNQASTIDRPWFYTFHGVVSKTSAATIGTSPWNDRTKKQRRVVGSYTTGPAMQRLRPMMDMETCAVVSAMHYDGRGGEAEIVPHIYLKRLALNTMTMFCYGTRFDSVEDPMLQQILTDANTIASFRSTNSNPQDFIPHLRYLPSDDRRGEIAKEVRSRRDKWLAAMLEGVRNGISKRKGPQKTVAGMLLTEREEGLTDLDVKTILGGLMSGGFETVFSTAIIAVGLLSTPEHRDIQQRAYEDIMSHYPGGVEEAFDRCLAEEKSTYVAALVKETLRCYPPLKLLPARQTFKEFVYQGAVIPKGVLVYTNTQAISRDTSAYGPDAATFRPSRWLEKDSPTPGPPYHFAFGAGQRACTAINFSNRLLYATLVRLIVSFRIEGSKDMPAETDYIDYKANASDSNAIAKEFKVRLVPREKDVLERCSERSQEVAGAEGEGEKLKR